MSNFQRVKTLFEQFDIEPGVLIPFKRMEEIVEAANKKHGPAFQFLVMDCFDEGDEDDSYSLDCDSWEDLEKSI